jgi:peptide/nickel transport system ATP-binding protein
MIKLNNVSKVFKSGWFKTNTAVSDVSFVVGEGRTLGIVGNSGCGKSTVARLITGLIEPTEGEITVDGEPVKRAGFFKKRNKAQLIFQHPESALNPKMTVEESLLEPLRIHYKISRSESITKVESIMKKLGLSRSLLTRYPHQISGGEAQRIAIGRALLLEPKILVLDEATSMLDVSIQAAIIAILKEIQEAFDFTYVLISHDLELLRVVCDDLVVMQNGKIVDMGLVETVLTSPKSEFTKNLIQNYEFFYKEVTVVE